MNEPFYRKLGLFDSSGVSLDDTLSPLVRESSESGRLLADGVNGELESIKEAAGEGVKAASETESSKLERVLEYEQEQILLSTLEMRFRINVERHKGLDWGKLVRKLAASREKIWSLQQMEDTGGEPDVVGFDEKTGEYIFMDCSAETPRDRRNCLYDSEGEEGLKIYLCGVSEDSKQNFLSEKYNGNAVSMAAFMGINLLNEEEYLYLQELGEFDRKTFSWLKTSIREDGLVRWGCRSTDVGFDESYAYYHSNRMGFRGSLRV